MTDKEIVKALECCGRESCFGCPYHGKCHQGNPMIKDALDLINRQQAENKRLGKEVDLVSIQFQDLQERYEESQAEIERLKECPKCVYEYDGETMEYCVQGPCPNFKTVEQIKSETVKEFAERLKEDVFNTEYHIDRYYRRTIDNLLKEMVGEDK